MNKRGTLQKVTERLYFTYTVNHKKRNILFLTITLANLNRFLQFLYYFNCEEILHATTLCLKKNDTDVAGYIFNAHQPILIVLAGNS